MIRLQVPKISSNGVQLFYSNKISFKQLLEKTQHSVLVGGELTYDQLPCSHSAILDDSHYQILQKCLSWLYHSIITCIKIKYQ